VVQQFLHGANTPENLHLTNTSDCDSDILSSERAPCMDRTVIFRWKEICGHERQVGLDTNTDRLTVSCNVTLTLPRHSNAEYRGTDKDHCCCCNS
jgi:hypothetical protein